MSQETWQSLAGGQEIPVSERGCPACTATQVRRRPAEAFLAPTGSIKGIVNGRLSGPFHELEEKEIPLRLDAPGWNASDEVSLRPGVGRS